MDRNLIPASVRYKEDPLLLSMNSKSLQLFGTHRSEQSHNLKFMKTALKTQIVKMIDMHMRNINERITLTKQVVYDSAKEGMSLNEVKKMLEDHLQQQSSSGQLSDDHIQNRLAATLQKFDLKCRSSKLQNEVQQYVSGYMTKFL